MVRDILRAYPEIDGLRIDWPEYPPYSLDGAFFDFGPHAETAAADDEVDAAALDVGEVATGFKLAVEDGARQRQKRNIAVVGRNAVQVHDACRLGQEDARAGDGTHQAGGLEGRVDLEEVARAADAGGGVERDAVADDEGRGAVVGRARLVDGRGRAVGNQRDIAGCRLDEDDVDVAAPGVHGDAATIGVCAVGLHELQLGGTLPRVDGNVAPGGLHGHRVHIAAAGIQQDALPRLHEHGTRTASGYRHVHVARGGLHTSQPDIAQGLCQRQVAVDERVDLKAVAVVGAGAEVNARVGGRRARGPDADVLARDEAEGVVGRHVGAFAQISEDTVIERPRPVAGIDRVVFPVDHGRRGVGRHRQARGEAFRRGLLARRLQHQVDVAAGRDVRAAEVGQRGRGVAQPAGEVQAHVAGGGGGGQVGVAARAAHQVHVKPAGTVANGARRLQNHVVTA